MNEDLCVRIAQALRKLPLCRAGFEGRTRVADWGFLGLWPIGDDLEPVIRQRAADIASSILTREQIPPRREKNRPIARDVCAMIGRRYAAQSYPPDTNWRAVLFELRCEVKHVRVTLHRVTKDEILEQVAFTYFELTGGTPTLSYNGRPTHFERLCTAIFDGPLAQQRQARLHQLFQKVGEPPAPLVSS